ncbi:MAG: homoserine kinase [Balneolaceae bacterium]|nr:MAG: homoserine kinase [Balneolaceae bacterium]
MKNRTITVFAPATVANVACGFDSLGFALNEPGDVIKLTRRDEPGIRITRITGDNGRLPLETDKNTAGVSVKALLEHTGEPCGFDIEVHKQMPLGSGLGSSSASTVGAVFGANLLLDKPLTREQLLPFALLGEKVACGAAHADNVAPSLLGGFQLIRSYDPLDVIEVPHPEGLHCTVLHPHIEVMTEDSRKILRQSVRLKDAIVQWSNFAGLVTGLITGNYPLISRSLNDIIFEPVRSLLIPGYDNVKIAAMDAGALGCSISGSGPSIFALSTSMAGARNVGDAMLASLKKTGIEGDVYVSPINKTGPRIVEEG